MKVEEIISRLMKSARPIDDASLARFGLKKESFLGVPLPLLHEIGREVGGADHSLALGLWATGFHEARILACNIEDPSKLTPEQADEWTMGMDSWILCDHCCGSLFWRAEFAMVKAVEWAELEAEYARRTGFSLISAIAHHVGDSEWGTLGFFDYSLFLARKHASDESSIVRKAVSWALGSIGARSRSWHEAAIEAADEIRMQPSGNAKWVAHQAIAALMSTSSSRRGIMN